MIEPSTIIYQYLTSTLSVFTAFAASGTWVLYQSFLPDNDDVEDNVAAIYDDIPYIQGKDMRGSLNQRYGIQVVIRSRDYTSGYQKAIELIDTLQNKSQVSEVVDSTTYIIENISSRDGAISTGIEEGTKRRYIAAVSLLVTIKEQ